METERTRPAESRKQRVFISYRRSDCQPQANGIHDGLAHRLSSVKLFMDIDSIPPGVDFEEHIRSEIEVCDVVLVLIGDNWLDPDPATGRPRLEESEDFVRLELESALASPRVRILPVLVEGAVMPRTAELPESLRALTRINAIEMSDRRWTADLERLAARLQEMASEQADRAKGDALHAAVPAPSPQWTTQHTPVQFALPPAGHGIAAASQTKFFWVMIALSLCTCGVASFVPPLWAASRRPDDRKFRVRMWQTAGVLGAFIVTGFVLVGTAPTDSTGTPVGAASNIGVTILLLCAVVGTIIAAMQFRGSSKSELPGTARELGRRRSREQYRELIEEDVNLARSINVGRPDLKRDYDDGGLLDLNNLSAEAISKFGGVSPDVAQRIVAARQQLGRLSSLDEVAVYAEVPDFALDRLRDTAVFL